MGTGRYQQVYSRPSSRTPFEPPRNLIIEAERRAILLQVLARRGIAFRAVASSHGTSIVIICGACERELPDDSYSRVQRELRQGIRRCEECVAAGNQLVLMRKGRTRSETDDCPICQLPLPLDGQQSVFRLCCMKVLCKGCDFAAQKRGMIDCPFCRAPTPKKESQAVSMVQKRVDAGDPVAIHFLGTKYRFGRYGLEEDITRAAELYERAAELGVKEAHCNLGVIHDEGTNVEKDMYKAIRHYEAAAMCGHVLARYNLGCKSTMPETTTLHCSTG